MSNQLSRRRRFSLYLFIIQILLVVLYIAFVRIKVHNKQTENTLYYPAYQDVNVMMLIGFGFLMTFIHTHSWSALIYTFFINALVVQLYILLGGFWEKVFHGDWGTHLQLTEKDFTAASYCVAAVLIAFGGVLGRVGPFDLLIMGIVQTLGYTLNQKIIYDTLKLHDVGGSTAIHTFGAYFGLSVSLIIGRKTKPARKFQSSYTSNIFALIGTLFLWMYWPSFNAGFFPTFPYERSLIIGNTILSLTGSCLSTFVMSGWLRQKFNLDDILNATLAGGVMIGASSGMLTNPGVSLLIGIIAGIISTFGYNFVTEKLQHSIGLYDTCGIHNLHAVPGLLGGIISGVVLFAYHFVPLTDKTQTSYLQFYSHPDNSRTLFQQGGIQIVGTLVSMLIGIGLGIITGMIISYVSTLQKDQFYDDSIHFDVPLSTFGNTNKNNYEMLK